MSKSTKPKIFIVVFAILLLFATALSGYCYSVFRVPPVTDCELQEHGIDNASKLLIVAHPDDDILWGGAHLMEKGYFVVVITNKTNLKRKKEFYNVLEASGNDGIILAHPDKTFGKKDSWDRSREGIQRDLEKIIRYKHWDLIVTHNVEGEYGHIHHKMTHSFVRDIYRKYSDELNTKLYFFGKYYNKTDILDVQDSMPRITEEQLKFKEDMLKLYTSQKNTIAMFNQMNPFEEWTLYDGSENG